MTRPKRNGYGLKGEMIDLRGDVVALSTEGMWQAMRWAELGWAMGGEDLSVNELAGRQIQSRSRGTPGPAPGPSRRAVPSP